LARAIDELMQEHRVIEGVLGALETFAEGVRAGGAAERRTVADFAAFLRDFADRCHHGKEEDRLFVAMTARGFPADRGPIAVMLAEHGEGREHVQALAEIGAGSGALSDDERTALADHALAYVPLLRAYIMKEDHVLYPMALQALPAEEMERLAAEFAAFEAEVVGPGRHAALHALAQSLGAAYPPPAPPGGRARPS
jgi:hemerythrin-like domain-containing protein